MKRIMLAGLALLGSVMPSFANVLNLDASTTGSINFTGLGLNVGVAIPSPLSGPGLLQGDVNQGTYILAPPAPALFTAGPGPVLYPITGVNEGFLYTAADGVLSGVVSWALLVGPTINPEFLGTFNGIGSGVFAGIHTGLTINLETTNLPTTLDTLASSHGFSSVGVGQAGIQSIKGVPGPVEGSGFLGLIAAAFVGGIYWLGKKRFVAAA